MSQGILAARSWSPGSITAPRTAQRPAPMLSLVVMTKSWGSGTSRTSRRRATASTLPVMMSNFTSKSTRGRQSSYRSSFSKSNSSPNSLHLSLRSSLRRPFRALHMFSLLMLTQLVSFTINWPFRLSNIEYPWGRCHEFKEVIREPITVETELPIRKGWGDGSHPQLQRAFRMAALQWCQYELRLWIYYLRPERHLGSLSFLWGQIGLLLPRFSSCCSPRLHPRYWHRAGAKYWGTYLDHLWTRWSSQTLEMIIITL